MTDTKTPNPLDNKPPKVAVEIGRLLLEAVIAMNATDDDWQGQERLQER